MHGQKLQLLQQHCPLWLLQEGMKGQNMDVRYLAQLRDPLAMSASLFQQVTNTVLVQHTSRATYTDQAAEILDKQLVCVYRCVMASKMGGEQDCSLRQAQ